MYTNDNVEDDKEKQILPGYDSIETFTKNGYKTLMEAIRCSNSLPNGKNWNFYNTHEAFVNILKEDSSRILKNINTILHNNAIDGSIRNRSSDEQTELMIEANDIILERIANNIDEMNGFKKTINEPVLIQTVSAQLPLNGSWNRVNNTTFSVSSSLPSEVKNVDRNSVRLLTGKNIIRPQVLFKDTIINSCKYPWEPRIKEKPNSLKPLSILLEETERGEEFSHPYELELDRFKPPPEQLAPEQPEKPLPMESTPLVEINTPEEVDKLVATLKKSKVFAVDLEHHAYRSFMGITCLMQISTKETDYIVDTLSLRDKLYVLNEVFTDPSILKIFHGADLDIQWLQRDLSLYVVNMFDTHQAARQLDYSGASLAYLMKKFCDLAPNKQFQLADWRIRPLPEELKSYAREDTHYLIYIYQMMKSELLRKANGKDNILLSVFNLSTEVCKQRYFRPVLTPDSYLDFYRKCKRLFDNRQLYALRELYNWRDQLARDEDESTSYVLPNHMLLQISETLPREVQGIFACCNPIPPLVRANALEIHQIILRAREQHVERAILQEDTRARGTTLKISRINVDSPLHCPHDLTKTNEFCEDLRTLLDKKSNKVTDLLEKNVRYEQMQSVHSIFNSDNNIWEVDQNRRSVPKLAFLGPFDRYKLVKPYIKAVEERSGDDITETDKETQTTEKPSIEEQPVQDSRTDEERIESIREHFLKLSRLPETMTKPQDQSLSLLQMGGTKKRKRMSSLERDHDTPELTTTRNNNDLNPLKRKSSELPGAVPKNKVKRRELFRNINKKKFAQQSNLSNIESSIDSHNTNVSGVNANANSGRGGKKRNKGNRNKKNPPQGKVVGEQGSSGDFTPYDYSSVNFQEFQGGAGHASTAQEFRGSFKSKNRKRGGRKSNNKSSTFGNAQHDRDRGRGRGDRGGHK